MGRGAGQHATHGRSQSRNGVATIDAQIELAAQIAKDAHRGQLDDDGTEHFEHARAVADLLEGKAKAVGYLHDVIEDTGRSRDDLIAAGVDPEIADAVQIVSRDPSKETYWEFIYRIIDADEPLSLAAKLADNAVNLRRSLASGHTLARRYERVRALLRPAAERHGIQLVNA